MEILQQLGKIAGIAGIALGGFVIIFREIIRKSIFPNLSKNHGYRLLRLVIILTFSIAIIGIGAWVYLSIQENKTNEPKYDPLILNHKDT